MTKTINKSKRLEKPENLTSGADAQAWHTQTVFENALKVVNPKMGNYRALIPILKTWITDDKGQTDFVEYVGKVAEMILADWQNGEAIPVAFTANRSACLALFGEGVSCGLRDLNRFLYGVGPSRGKALKRFKDVVSARNSSDVVADLIGDLKD